MIEPGPHFMLGNAALAEGAFAAGCNFVAGYPITPASEILEHISKLFLGTKDRNFIQMEDEIASMASLIGASWAGAKAMTATSGPGFSLMQENIGLACMTETPCVIVDVQRSGPSTGQATLPAQGDFYQARYGSHGDYAVVVLSPWSVQEMYDLVIDAFNFAERLRVPVIFLTDGEIGHLEENVIIPDPATLKIEKRKRPDYSLTPPVDVEPFAMTDDLVPPMPLFGDGANLLVTGSAHRPSGLRNITADVHRVKVNRIINKIETRKKNLWLHDKHYCDDASDGLIISYGVSARQAMEALLQARKQGRRIGMLRLKTLWPFPDEVIQEICNEQNTGTVYVVEMAVDKLVREVERATAKTGVSRVIPMPKIGGEIHKVKEIYRVLTEEISL
ncbi:MAG: 2-oxoacid:acceptor oxidoreductase subunit alpha [Candidatus Odinarchaeota archaeon]